MAKADDTSSTIVWIWLREALELAVTALGSVKLAQELLIEWLAAGKLPWSCTKWKVHTAEEIAKAEQQLRTGPIIYEFPSVAYHEGDPKFWGVFRHIDWEDNTAVEPVLGGARARGIKVSRTHLLTLLPKELTEREEVRGAGAWIAAEAKRMKKDGKIPKDIKITDFAKELERRMKAAAAVDRSLRAVKWRYIKNKLPDWDLWPVSSIP